MGKFRAGESREQITFLPRSLDEYVCGEDPVRFIDALIEEFDLSSIEGAYSMQGRPAFSPRVLCKIILYGKVRGIRSCRELSQATRENVKFMFLAKGEQPDFRTINLFRKRFYKDLSELLGQTVHIALSEGMLKLEHVAIDSTKIRGYASKKSYKEPAELAKLFSEVQKELEASFVQDISADADTNEDEPKLPPDLQDKMKLQEKARKALATYTGMTESGTKKKAPKKISITDPECRYQSGGTGPLRGYNMQAAVDAKSRIMVAGYATTGSDNSQLIPLLLDIERNAGKLPSELSADKGYSEYEGLLELKRCGVTGYIAQIDRPLKDGKLSDLPASRVLSEKQKVAQEMCARTSSPAGQKIKKLRGSTIETVFAHLKHARHLLRIPFRGIDMVDAFWKMELIGINLEKIAKFRMQRVIPA